MKTAREAIHRVLFRYGRCDGRLTEVESHSRLCDALTFSVEQEFPAPPEAKPAVQGTAPAKETDR